MSGKKDDDFFQVGNVEASGSVCDSQGRKPPPPSQNSFLGEALEVCASSNNFLHIAATVTTTELFHFSDASEKVTGNLDANITFTQAVTLDSMSTADWKGQQSRSIFLSSRVQKESLTTAYFYCFSYFTIQVVIIMMFEFKNLLALRMWPLLQYIYLLQCMLL